MELEEEEIKSWVLKEKVIKERNLFFICEIIRKFGGNLWTADNIEIVFFQG